MKLHNEDHYLAAMRHCPRTCSAPTIEDKYSDPRLVRTDCDYL